MVGQILIIGENGVRFGRLMMEPMHFGKIQHSGLIMTKMVMVIIGIIPIGTSLMKPLA